MTLKIILIALGGALGALGRYALAGLVHRVLPADFPWGTMGVNLLGCFLIGFLWAYSEHTAVNPAFRTFILIGILGAFTTFSTFGLETVNLLRDREIGFALLNITATNTLGFALVYGGIVIARACIQGLR